MSKNIYIIGAGISGLIAAWELEQAGYAPVILEKQSFAGGRVCTDSNHEIPLDIGFQVVLSEYPAVKKYIDFSSLPHSIFLPGAIIYNNGKINLFGDPLRNLSFLIPTITTTIASLSDKFKIYTLKNKLAKKTVEQLFAMPNSSTRQFLQDYGFSENCITNFFTPFYAGIFLEPNLQTSCRMFCFVFAMFSKGNAILPTNGMQSVVQHLQQKLKHTKILLQHNVDNIIDKTIYCNNTTYTADAIIIATDAQHILTSNAKLSVEYNSCTNLYFSCAANTINQNIIGLIANDDALINNICFVPNTSIISVTVVKPYDYEQSLLIEIIRLELQVHCNIIAEKCIAVYKIKNALPICKEPIYKSTAAQIIINGYTFLAGDYLANASMNASMLSGELAAKCVVDYLSK